MNYTANEVIADIYETYGVRFKMVFSETVEEPGDKRVFPTIESAAFPMVKSTLRLSNLRENIYVLMRAAGYWSDVRIIFIDPNGKEIGANTVIATAQRHYRKDAAYAYGVIDNSRTAIEGMTAELDRMLSADYSTLDTAKLKKLAKTILNTLEY